MIRAISEPFPALAARALLLLLGLSAASCGGPDPSRNTPTSGHLIVFVDEMYKDLFAPLADSFMAINPNATIEIRSATAREAISKVFEIHQRIMDSDTALSVAAIIGRHLLGDEREAVDRARLEMREYAIAYDGLVLAVPLDSPMRETMLGQVDSALRAPSPTARAIDANAPEASVRFLVPDQNSSTYAVLRDRILGDSDIVAPTDYLTSADSVADLAASGQGVGVLAYFRVHLDSARLRALDMGWVDSTGRRSGPVDVHPTTLVTDAYPVKQPVVGYTFALTNSLANGFLTWIARGGTPQRYITLRGLQSENITYRIQL